MSVRSSAPSILRTAISVPLIFGAHCLGHSLVRRQWGRWGWGRAACVCSMDPWLWLLWLFRAPPVAPVARMLLQPHHASTPYGVASNKGSFVVHGSVEHVRMMQEFAGAVSTETLLDAIHRSVMHWSFPSAWGTRETWIRGQSHLAYRYLHVPWMRIVGRRGWRRQRTRRGVSN